MTDWNTLCQQTHDAVQFPQVGDWFHEMFSYHIFVVALTDGDMIATMEAGGRCTFPNEALARWQSLGHFRKRLAYSTMSGYWVKLGKRGIHVDGWLDHAATIVMPDLTQEAR